MSAAVLEIVGPPGSGKSSLVRALVAPGGGAVKVGLRDNASRAALVRSAAAVSIPFLAQAPAIRGRKLYRLSAMVQLRAYADVVERLRREGRTLALDQGPVYLMAIVRRALRGEAGRDAASFTRYWESTLDHWSRALHLVVVLDAPDAVLLERVRARGTAHSLLTRTPEDAAGHLDRTRRRLREIVSTLASRGGPLEVMEVATAGEPIEAVAAGVRDRLAAVRDRAGGTVAGPRGGGDGAVEPDGRTSGGPARSAGTTTPGPRAGSAGS